MKKILFLILFFASLASFGQVYDYQVQAADILQSDNYFVWKGDTIRKDSIAYLDNHIDSIRVKYINGQFSKWIANSEKIRQWIANNHVSSIAFSGTTTKTLTLNQVNGGTKTAMFTDLDQQTLSTTASGNTRTITISGGNSVGFDVSDPTKEPVFSKGDLNSGNAALTVTNGTSRLVSGTATISVASGYSIPSTASQTSWNNKQNQLNGTGFVKASGTTISYDNSTYEPAFSKNTAFNKNFGITSGTVLEGRTFGTAANSATTDFAPASGSGNYIQNGTATQTANFNISGNGTIGNSININSSSTTGHKLGYEGADPYFRMFRASGGSPNTFSWQISVIGGSMFKIGWSLADKGGETISSYADKFSINSSGDAVVQYTIKATTAKLTNLTDGYIPYHISDASGLGNTQMYISGGGGGDEKLNIGTVGGNSGIHFKHLTGTNATDMYLIGGNDENGTSGLNVYNSSFAGIFKITNSGNVGVGYSTGTEISNNKLAVNGSGYFNGSIRATTAKFTTGATAEYFWKCTNSDGSGGWFPIAASNVYKGTYDASNNTPALTNGTGTQGWYYRVVISGTQNFGGGNITFSIGDDVYYNGSIWQRVPGQGYALQPATASVLGGVKIGSGVTVQADGTISVSTAYRPDSWVPAWSDITLKPTTVSGFGITDAMTTAHAANIVTSTNISNWNTAFGWGNHAGLYRPISYVPSWSEITSNPFSFASSANGQLIHYNSASGKWENWTPNYLTSFTETDPVFSVHTVHNIVNGTGFLKNNGSGTWSWDNSTYLTGITSAQVTTALGYTPYNSSNPAGYITSSALSGYATQSWVSSNFDKYTSWLVSANYSSPYNVHSGGQVDFYNGSGVTVALSAITGGFRITPSLDIYGLATIANPTTSYYIPITSTGLNSKITIAQIEGLIGTTTGSASRLIMRDSSADAYAHNFILSSDRRLKKNIIDLPNTDWTNKIEFKQFQFKDDPKEKTRYGVIAQDVEKIAPQLVSTDSEGNKAVAYIDLLIAKIAELEKRIKILENESFKNR